MLVWNVFREDVNRNRIYEFNVFNHHYFIEDCVKTFKKYKGDREKLKRRLNTGFSAIIGVSVNTRLL